MAVAVDKDADAVRARAAEAEKPAEPTLLERYRARYAWLDHLVRAGARYTERHGDHYAAAITYFSVLALFPLILVSVAALGYVLFLQPDLLDQLKAGISANAPAGLDDLINPIVDNAIESRNTIGIIGLLGALYTGIGWMSNLREALSEQWGQPPTAPAIVKKTLFDLLTLVGLGAAMIGSFAITGLVFGFTGTILEFVGLAEQGWAKFLLGLFGVLLGLAANWLIFLWVIARLPREHATLRSAAKAAVLGAVGFEVLKQVMTVYLASVTESPTGQIIGPFIGLMVFAFFTSRFILFVTAWAATSRENEQEEEVEVPGPAVIHSEVTVRSGPAAGTAAGLVGAGAIAGVLGAGLLRGRRRD
ncbi:YhjD/YihY/BrkB family envelope integrity protein [Pseudonocardia hydrocarbonoxydans]|uniref:Inner membrane protein YhjD n=1 Tax=Pseudonocardia hydrocarbonoxydans TaxID=76726 RepID=A0A4Y3WNJ6_9PSEU|nr:YhjD/YihY/BrkB family envelope integrity protein [Pseudonocardia hydrocarbonoxydans]GEC20443.1 inner membrane protein YhjD [Pseudonocardia hydrocarbonoxydans]